MVSLDVYVSRGCTNCRFARAQAARTAEAFPAVRVRVLELDDGIELPDNVFATPTYLLEGQVLSLGNPDEEELFTRLTAALAAVVM